jgi:hypothetical protein
MGPVIELQDSKGAVTKAAVRAQGFDEASIAAAIGEVGSPTTAVASAAAAEAKTPAITNASAGTTTAVAAAPGKANATTSVARAAAAPAADARTSVTAFATPPTTAIAATVNKEPPLYRRLLAKLPFGSDDPAKTDPSQNPAPDAAAIDQAAPLPPVRPSSLSRDSSRRSTSPQANLGTEANPFSSQAIFATLPSFMKGTAPSWPTMANGFVPLDR